MIDGHDRVVDLVGPRTVALHGGTEADVIAAVERCDVDRLAVV
jgi:hypothetical protein